VPIRRPRPHAGSFPVSIRRRPYRHEGCRPRRHQAPSLVGARQGCPGSPTLFGCTVDRLPAYLDAHAPDAGILIQVGDDGELLVSHLMYADDIVLLGDSPTDLQQLLDALSGFCAALGLDISLAKTHVMCFGLPVAAPPPAFTYAGRTLPHTDSYKYLVTTFTPAGMAGDGLAQVRSNVGRAFNNVRFKFDRLGCTSNIHLQLHLYDAIVTSAALSSCEVWGVHPAAQQQRRRLAALHRRYIRRICLLPDSVPTEALMAELGRMDIETRWLAHTLRFWNSLCDQPPDSLPDTTSCSWMPRPRHCWLAPGPGCGAFGGLVSGWVISWCSAHGGRSGWTCGMSWIWRRHSGDGHGRLSAYAHGHARARAQPSAHTGGGSHARRGNRNACRFSASGTRRGGLATIYDFGLGAALCRW